MPGDYTASGAKCRLKNFRELRVNTPVDANNIADIRDITFLDIIRNRDMQKIFTTLVYEAVS